MSRPDNLERSQRRSHGTQIAIIVACFAAVCGVGVLMYGLFVFMDSPSQHTTLLEQNAGDSRTANVEVCGSTVNTLSTGLGLFKMAPTDVDILNHIKAVRHSVIEIAYKDDTIELIGEANTSVSTRSIYYCP